MCGSGYLLLAAMSVMILKDDDFFDITTWLMKYWLNRVHIYLCDAVDEFCLFQSLQWFQLILSTAKHWHENLNCWCRVEYIHSLHLSLSNFLSHLSKIFVPFVPFVPSIVHFVPKTLSCPKKTEKRQRQNGQNGQWYPPQ